MLVNIDRHSRYGADFARTVAYDIHFLDRYGIGWETMVRLDQTAQFLNNGWMRYPASGAARRQGDRQSAEQGIFPTIPNMAHRTKRASKVVQSDQTSDFAASIMLRDEEVRRAVTKAVRSFVSQVTYTWKSH